MTLINICSVEETLLHVLPHCFHGCHMPWNFYFKSSVVQNLQYFHTLDSQLLSLLD